ncbi:MAG: ABC transporter permease [Candidatus Eremiobacteraeota bacterium]|nr:ABC transporter permease [Candidatus Eremiobacteraeota bacterium]
MTARERFRDTVERNSRAAFARAWARVKGMNREPSWMIFEVVLPLLTVASYVYVYKALDSPVAFIGYVILGGSMIGFWMNVLWGMMSQLYWEKERGLLDHLLIAPFSLEALLLGMALGGMYNTGLRALTTFFLGIWIFKVPLVVSSWGAFALTFMVTLFALYSLGMLGSSLFLMYGRDAWHFSNLLQEPIFLVTGFYFPVARLGYGIAAVASLIPVTLGLDAMRQVLFGEGTFIFLPLALEIALIILLGIIYFVLALKALRFMERRARREGRLTLRWQ